MRKMIMNLQCISTKGGDDMQRTARYFESNSPPRKSITIKTTLFNLIEAVNDALQPGEEQLAPAIVMDLLNSYQSKPMNKWN
jgi:hypothetical protein